MIDDPHALLCYSVSTIYRIEHHCVKHIFTICYHTTRYIFKTGCV